jgi:hypothetical protein
MSVEPNFFLFEIQNGLHHLDANRTYNGFEYPKAQSFIIKKTRIVFQHLSKSY